jgi:hypothetical protein
MVAIKHAVVALAVICVFVLTYAELVAAQTPAPMTPREPRGPVGLCCESPNCRGSCMEKAVPCEICRDEFRGRGFVTGNPRKCYDVRPGCPR